MAVTIENKPKLSIWDIWNMSFGFFGIQFGFALQGGFVSRIFKDLGAENGELPLLWLAGPLTGFLVQPIVGYLSDRTWGKYGRRKPYFLVGAILSSLALIVLPNSPTLWVAAGMLWILDASINISMEPFRALVGDKLPQSQQTYGFTVQSVIIGAGAVVASVMPKLLSELGVSTNTTGGEITPHLKWSFYIGAIFFLGTILWTIYHTKEDPPEDMEEFLREKREGAGPLSGFKHIVDGIKTMPRTMAQLAFVQFFSWFGLFAMWTFTHSTIAENLGLEQGSEAYQEAGDMVGLHFGAMNLVAAIFGFILPIIAKKITRKTTHMICLAIGGVGLASVTFVGDLYTPFISYSLIGIAWASILSMPYAMLASALPPKKMGLYMGVFNFFIVIPQIIAATGGLMGLMNIFFESDTKWAMVIAGVSFMLGAVSVLLVNDTDQNRGESAA